MKNDGIRIILRKVPKSGIFCKIYLTWFLAKRNLASLSLPAFGGLVRFGGIGCNSALNTIEFAIQYCRLKEKIHPLIKMN